MRPRSRPTSLLAFYAAACQPPQADTLPATLPPITSVADADASSGAAESGSTGSVEGSSSTTSAPIDGLESSETTAPLLDVGTDHDLGDPPPPGCKGKIDFLFVISRSGGMAWFQTQLLDAFPKFIDTIEAKFSDFDYHIMLVDGDPYWGVSTCDEQCPTPGQGICNVPDYPCDYVSSACDRTMGAGVVFPAGTGATNEPCKIDGGRRYMVKGQTDLRETFACAAQIGSSGHDLLGEALTAAMQPALNEPGGCNAGFLRDDALLMVTLISNTVDEQGYSGSKGTPWTWTEAVLEAKHGDLESVVMFSIHYADSACEWFQDRICVMLEMFPYHLFADRDEPDYGPSFAAATDLVATACAGFTPPD